MTRAVTYQETLAATEEALAAPQVGDRCHEMYTLWMYVVAIEADAVITMVATAPCVFPRDGRLERHSCVHAFRDYWHDSVGPTVLLADRHNDVTGWYEAAWAREGKVYDPITGGGL